MEMREETKAIKKQQQVAIHSAVVYTAKQIGETERTINDLLESGWKLLNTATHDGHVIFILLWETPE